MLGGGVLGRVVERGVGNGTRHAGRNTGGRCRCRGIVGRVGVSPARVDVDVPIGRGGDTGWGLGAVQSLLGKTVSVASEIRLARWLLLGHARQDGLHSTHVGGSGVVIVHAGHNVLLLLLLLLLLLVQLVLLVVILLREPGGKGIVPHGLGGNLGDRGLSLLANANVVVGSLRVRIAQRGILQLVFQFVDHDGARWHGWHATDRETGGWSGRRHRSPGSGRGVEGRGLGWLGWVLVGADHLLDNVLGFDTKGSKVEIDVVRVVGATRVPSAHVQDLLGRGRGGGRRLHLHRNGWKHGFRNHRFHNGGWWWWWLLLLLLLLLLGWFRFGYGNRQGHLQFHGRWSGRAGLDRRWFRGGFQSQSRRRRGGRTAAAAAPGRGDSGFERGWFRFVNGNTRVLVLGFEFHGVGGGGFLGTRGFFGHGLGRGFGRCGGGWRKGFFFGLDQVRGPFRGPNIAASDRNRSGYRRWCCCCLCGGGGGGRRRSIGSGGGSSSGSSRSVCGQSGLGHEWKGGGIVGIRGGKIRIDGFRRWGCRSGWFGSNGGSSGSGVRRRIVSGAGGGFRGCGSLFVFVVGGLGGFGLRFGFRNRRGRRRTSSPGALESRSRDGSGDSHRRNGFHGGRRGGGCLWLGGCGSSRGRSRRRCISFRPCRFLVVPSVAIAIVSFSTASSASASAGSPTAVPSSSRVSVSSSTSATAAGIVIATTRRSFLWFLPLVDGFPRFFHPCRGGFFPPSLDFFHDLCFVAVQLFEQFVEVFLFVRGASASQILDHCGICFAVRIVVFIIFVATAASVRRWHGVYVLCMW
mmetsp:Transcript_14070/g.29704  ORF Transcript_14070/g.29704 Transcript_14070/m.29704 type:complete len:799 (+) Transcript_14070:1168-3564(+)